MNSLAIVILAVGGLLIFSFLFIVLSIMFRPKVDVQNRVRLRTPVQEEEPTEEKSGWRILTSWRAMGAAAISRVEGLFKPLGEILPRSPEEMSKVERRLVQAGIRRKDGAVLFYGVQIGLVGIFIVAGVASGYIYRNPMLVLPLAVVLGFFVPSFILSKCIDARRERIQMAIPDALDLAVVCVEAGLGLDQALIRIADELHAAYPDLSDEFRLRNIEINMGRSRVEAFRNLADRAGVDDLKSLVAILIQTDRFGTSVGQALRVFAESLRIKRQQRAREHAAKLPVKMIPIMILFIFPSIFVVVLVPGVIQIIRGLLPALAGN
jgi:tight adherence protein C